MQSCFIEFLLIILVVFSPIRCQYCSSSMKNVELTCSQIENKTLEVVGALLTCSSRLKQSIVSTDPGSSIVSVSFNNGSAATNLPKIRSLAIIFGTVKFIPSGLKSKFINLKALSIKYSGLLSINKENLREFGSSLEYLSLSCNLLISIDADLFDYSANLKVIGLRDNPIQFIEPGFFANIKSLKSVVIVNFNPTSCTNQRFDISERHDMKTFKWIFDKCINETARIEARLAPIRSQLQHFMNNERCLELKIHTLIEENTEMWKTFKRRIELLEEKLEKKVPRN